MSPSLPAEADSFINDDLSSVLPFFNSDSISPEESEIIQQLLGDIPLHLLKNLPIYISDSTEPTSSLRILRNLRGLQALPFFDLNSVSPKCGFAGQPFSFLDLPAELRVKIYE